MTTPTVAVGAFVFDREGRILLIERGRPPGEGLWTVPDGKLEPRETLVQAVAREVREETGLVVEVGTLACVVEHISDGFHYVILESRRVSAVDPGEKRLGIAVSDPTVTLARPLTVIKHISRIVDAAAIAQLAAEQGAVRIVIGQGLDADGFPTPQARHAVNLAEAVRQQSRLLVELWDESDSTQAAQVSRVAMGLPKRKRGGHLDEIAATVILQSYLDAHFQNQTPSELNGERLDQSP